MKGYEIVHSLDAKKRKWQRQTGRLNKLTRAMKRLFFSYK